MAEEVKYNNTLVSGRADETLTYTKYVKDESSGKSTKELLDEKVNKTDQLGTTQIADKAVTKEKLAEHSVDNSKLSPDSVSYDKIQNDAVITEKIQDNAVTTEKVEEKAITNTKLGDQSVDGRVVCEASLETKHFAKESVTTEKVARRSITKDKLADNSVDASQVVDGSIGNAKLSPDSVTTEKIKDSSVTNEKVADDTLGFEKFDPELRKTIQAATGLPENLSLMIQNVDKSVKQLHEKDTDLKSQIDDNQQQITDNKSAQDAKNASLDENMTKLNTRDDQITETLKNISATGGASVASAVTYDNTTSQLTSANIQGAVDELQGAKIDKTSILQESGEAEDKVMSQKAVSAKLSDLSDEFNIELEKTNSKEITLNKNEYISIGTYETVVGDTAKMELVKNDKYNSVKFSVRKGDKIKLTGEGSTAARLWFIVDANNTIKQIAGNNAIATDNTVEVEHDGIFVFNTKNTIDSAFVRYISNYTKNINTVKTDIHSLRNELADYTGKDYDLVNGYSLYVGTYETVVGDTATMELVKNDKYNSVKFSVRKGDKIKLTGEGSTAARLWFIVDANNTIKQIAGNNAIATDNTVEVEHDGIFVFNTKNTIDFYIRKITNTPNEIKKDIEIFNKQKYELIENKATSVGIWSTNVGDTVIPTTVDKIGWATLIIDVTPNDTFILTGIGDTSNKLYCFIDKNNTVLAIAANGEARENYVIRVSDYVTQDCRMIYNTNRNGTINQYYVTQPISYLKKYSWIELKTEKTQSSMLVKWGDSLTNMGWGTAIEDYIVNKHLDITIHNVGTGGEDIFQISARIGSMPTFLESGIKLPVGSVKTQIGTKDSPNLYVVDENGNHHYIKLLLQGTEESINPLYINGIKCRLILEGDTYYLRSYYSLETEVMLQDNSNVFLAGSSKLYRPYIATLMIGANGGWDNDIDTLIKRTKKAIKNVGTPNYFIIGFFHNYTKEKALTFENRYIAEFGNRFINTRRFFVERAAAISGVTLSDNDKNDIANGRCPSKAFMQDYIHFNELGRQLLGKFVLERLIEFGLM